MVWNIKRLIHRPSWLFDLLHTRSMDWLNLSLGEPEKQMKRNAPVSSSIRRNLLPFYSLWNQRVKIITLSVCQYLNLNLNLKNGRNLLSVWQSQTLSVCQYQTLSVFQYLNLNLNLKNGRNLLSVCQYQTLSVCQYLEVT